MTVPEGAPDTLLSPESMTVLQKQLPMDFFFKDNNVRQTTNPDKRESL
jgi:hypothetical protein